MIILKEYPEHPLRLRLTEDDWDRLDSLFKDDKEQPCSLDKVSSEEIAAYEDWVFDEISYRLQTSIPSMVLQ
tara:strand:+ start:264 stop:479 length:216 start_codon:yes stop_codon:yes gene_type:complete